MLLSVGPFIIMEYVENDSDLVDALNTPSIYSLLIDGERMSAPKPKIDVICV